MSVFIGSNGSHDNNNVTILYAEDELIIQKFISIKLKNQGFRVLAVNNGRDAVNMFKYAPDARSIKCILMDVNMPYMDGLEAAYHIREHEKKCFSNKKVPIIIYSALEEDHIKSTCVNIGCNEYLKKPIKFDVLYNVISRLAI